MAQHQSPENSQRGAGQVSSHSVKTQYTYSINNRVICIWIYIELESKEQRT